MGMYDVINDDQIKMFTVCFPVLEDTGEYSIYESGGECKAYNIGDEVPWRRRYYNLGKNFDIVDMFSDDYDYDAKEEAILIHQIRDGKVFKSIPFNEHDGNFEFDAYTSYGIKFKEINKEVLKDYKEKLLYLQKLRTPKDDMLKEIQKYTNEHKGDKDFNEKVDEMFKKLEKQRQEDYEKYIRPVHEEMKKYIGEDFLGETFDNEQRLGIFVDSLVWRGTNYERFVVHDDRLHYIVLTAEMEEILKEVDLEHYFERFEMTKKEIKEFKKDIETIRIKNKKLKVSEYSKEQFVANALDDLNVGRYKDIYKKYNVKPYKNFDCSIWDK